MKYIFNGFIMLFSFYIIFLIFNGQASPLTYFTLILLEWLFILVGKPIVRQSVFSPFYRKGSLGEEGGPYGKIHIKSIKEDLNKIGVEGLKQLIVDLYEAKGYEVACILEEETGSYLLARRKKERVVIGVKYKAETEEVAWKEMTEAVSEQMQEAEATRGIVITNSKFQNYHIKEARPKRTQLMDYDLLVPFVKEGILLSRKNG